MISITTQNIFQALHPIVTQNKPFILLIHFDLRTNDLFAIQCNLAKRGMKISDPIFPIEMDLAKRGINVTTKRGIFLQLKWNIKLYFFDFGSW